MKKITKIIAASLLALCLITPAAACQNKDSGNNGGSAATATAQTNSVVGKWVSKLDESKVNEMLSSYPEEYRDQVKAMVDTISVTLEFKDDGTLIADGGTMLGGTVTSTYTQEGSVITVKDAQTSDGAATTSMQGGKMELGSDGVLRFTEANSSDPTYDMISFVRA